MNYKQKKKNIGRPKINWDSLSYDDYDFDQLDKIKNKQINKIKTFQKKIDKIDVEIKKLQKQAQKLELAKIPTKNTIDDYNADLEKYPLLSSRNQRFLQNRTTLLHS